MNRVIRLFPLPEVVLLPGTLLPLHIFEPRYRAMVADSLEGDRLIGMAMLKPGWEEGGDAPGIHEIGGAGEIVESEKLPDGRYNILLEGRFRYRVLHEQDGSAPYRIADVEEIASIPFPAGEDEERARRAADRLFESLSGPLELPPMPREALPAERFASEMALRLRHTPPELQALLETDSLAARYDSLIARMAEWEERMRFLAPYRPVDLDVRRN
ncbi:MAG TPA: LON peptidase substrate-binding domain-containing protein [Thermoanaerobaculia bacterium]|nr:LON peptidase substrate-binding domain-containing protein [Thermoanaerobaculia bacterium]